MTPKFSIKTKLKTFAIAVSIPLASAAMACTSMIIGEGPRSLLGQNYDFALGDGAIFVNASGKEKTSLAEGDQRALHWRAKYSSVAFAQFGKELPISGMNEKGLTIQGLWNEDASYPKVNRRETASLNELQWIQYQLDTAESVADVQRSLAATPIHQDYASLHYVVCEASGACALIDFDEIGMRIAKRGADFEPAAITNNTLIRSKHHAALALNTEEFADLSDDKNSLDAYTRAAWLVQRAGIADSRNLGAQRLHDMLEKTRVDFQVSDVLSAFGGPPPSATQWSIVFSPAERWVEWRTRDNPEMRRLDLTKLFRACPAPDIAFNVSKGKGVISAAHFSSPRAENQRIITAAYKNVEKQFPVERQKALVDYADSMNCRAK